MRRSFPAAKGSHLRWVAQIPKTELGGHPRLPRALLQGLIAAGLAILGFATYSIFAIRPMEIFICPSVADGPIMDVSDIVPGIWRICCLILALCGAVLALFGIGSWWVTRHDANRAT